MGGFVVFDEDRAWAVNGPAWRAVIEPAAEVLPEGSEPRLILEHAIRVGIHYLDLQGHLASDRQAIRDAVAEVRRRYERGDLPPFVTEQRTLALLRLLDGLLRMFDDPDFGRPMWPPPRTRPQPPTAPSRTRWRRS